MNFENSLTDAARWIWAHQHSPQWWTYLVLTNANQAKDTLGLDPTLAFNIFTRLETLGLMIPLVPPPFGAPPGVTAYRLNADRVKWNALMQPPGRLRKLGSLVFRMGRAVLVPAMVTTLGLWIERHYFPETQNASPPAVSGVPAGNHAITDSLPTSPSSSNRAPSTTEEATRTPSSAETTATEDR